MQVNGTHAVITPSSIASEDPSGKGSDSKMMNSILQNEPSSTPSSMSSVVTALETSHCSEFETWKKQNPLTYKFFKQCLDECVNVNNFIFLQETDNHTYLALVLVAHWFCKSYGDMGQFLHKPQEMLPLEVFTSAGGLTVFLYDAKFHTYSMHMLKNSPQDWSEAERMTMEFIIDKITEFHGKTAPMLKSVVQEYKAQNKDLPNDKVSKAKTTLTSTSNSVTAVVSTALPKAKQEVKFTFTTEAWTRAHPIMDNVLLVIIPRLHMGLFGQDNYRRIFGETNSHSIDKAGAAYLVRCVALQWLQSSHSIEFGICEAFKKDSESGIEEMLKDGSEIPIHEILSATNTEQIPQQYLPFLTKLDSQLIDIDEELMHHLQRYVNRQKANAPVSSTLRTTPVQTKSSIIEKEDSINYVECARLIMQTELTPSEEVMFAKLIVDIAAKSMKIAHSIIWRIQSPAIYGQILATLQDNAPKTVVLFNKKFLDVSNQILTLLDDIKRAATSKTFQWSNILAPFYESLTKCTSSSEHDFSVVLSQEVRELQSKQSNLPTFEESLKGKSPTFFNLDSVQMRQLALLKIQEDLNVALNIPFRKVDNAEFLLQITHLLDVAIKRKHYGDMVVIVSCLEPSSLKDNFIIKIASAMYLECKDLSKAMLHYVQDNDKQVKALMDFQLKYEIESQQNEQQHVENILARMEILLRQWSEINFFLGKLPEADQLSLKKTIKNWLKENTKKFGC